MLNFRNDYSVPAHPKVLQAVTELGLEANVGYGGDPYSAKAAQLIRELCKAPHAEVRFFIGGTSANLTAIAYTLRQWEAVIAAETGHINVHEGGAIEANGHKILAVPTTDGKLRPADIERQVKLHGDQAMVLPRMVYISQATEVGTVYTKEELTALSACCRENGLYLFVDGARLGTGLTAEGVDLTLADLATLTDAFYIGGTKNGALMGEAMVLTNPDLFPHFFRVMKQQGAVLAKGFLLGVQFDALLRDGLYWELARHANAMAQKLQSGLEAKGYPMLLHSPTNQIFPIVPDDLIPTLRELCGFEFWEKADVDHTTIRFVTSFATTEEEVDALLAAL